MKYVIPAVLLLIAGCGGSLSEEQRKAYREKMEMSKIVRVTDIEITEAAFAHGRALVRKLDSLGGDSAAVAAFLAGQPGRITHIASAAEATHPLEADLYQAYRLDTTGAYQDHVQSLRDDKGVVDSLLYSQPIVETRPDGQYLAGVWNVWMARRDLVLEISRDRE